MNVVSYASRIITTHTVLCQPVKVHLSIQFLLMTVFPFSFCLKQSDKGYFSVCRQYFQLLCFFNNEICL